MYEIEPVARRATCVTDIFDSEAIDVLLPLSLATPPADVNRQAVLCREGPGAVGTCVFEICRFNVFVCHIAHFLR